MTDLPFLPCVVELESRRRLEGEAEDEDFLRLVRPWERESCSAVLLSGGSSDCARYSIGCRDPFLTLRARKDGAVLRSPSGACSVAGDPLALLDRLDESILPDFPLVQPPFSGGAVGYLAYELKNHIERLPQTSSDERRLPEMLLFWPRDVLIHDRWEKRLHALRFRFSPSGSRLREQGPPRAPDLSLGASSRHSSPRVPASRQWLQEKLSERFTSNFTREEYVKAVGKIREYIRQGEVYQVNLSQRFQCAFNGNASSLWENLFAANPAPFYAFLQAGDHQIVSTSMERFLLRRGDKVEARPIKGTRPRGRTPDEDARLTADLLSHPKDDAELSMIVDLLRNDLGRVCRPRSVRVKEHKRLEAYGNVLHLVSVVEGLLRRGVTHGELLRATFPGGSITGCPRIRAMEIIDEMEPDVRHVYTGGIGYLGWHDNLDLSVAIRTAVIHQGTCTFSVGGGIVYDSVEEEEYRETLHKGATFFQVLQSAGGSPS